MFKRIERAKDLASRMTIKEEASQFCYDGAPAIDGLGIPAYNWELVQGKTSVIIQTIRRWKEKFRMAIIEGGVESIVDSEKIMAEGIPAVQIRTGGACPSTRRWSRLHLIA
jgi:hypothetical protein